MHDFNPASGTVSVPGASSLMQRSDNAQKNVATMKLLSALATLTKGIISLHPPHALLHSSSDAQNELAAAAVEDPAPAPTPSPPGTPPPVATALAGFQTRGPWVAGTLYLVVPTGPLVLIPEAPVADGEDTPLWYCITKGTFVGVHLNHALVLAAVSGVSGSAMESYKTQALAVDAFNEMLGFHGMVQIRP
ncbi:hypothetical protein DFH07DRAFT_763525 [Mycena maculata]|uniref:Uncharacterized protein n=1 Tax=Mycena maculata TaxID=230809 RepID=A0AAD7KHP4_9AGAR|nr:hypothetical protein DFH07DRAFT_763525 [Mycena maculata]